MSDGPTTVVLVCPHKALNLSQSVSRGLLEGEESYKALVLSCQALVRRVRKKPVSRKLILFTTEPWPPLSLSDCLPGRGSMTSSPSGQGWVLSKETLVLLRRNRSLARASSLRKEQKETAMHVLRPGSVE